MVAIDELHANSPETVIAPVLLMCCSGPEEITISLCANNLKHYIFGTLAAIMYFRVGVHSSHPTKLLRYSPGRSGTRPGLPFCQACVSAETRHSQSVAIPLTLASCMQGLCQMYDSSLWLSDWYRKTCTNAPALTINTQWSNNQNKSCRQGNGQ